MKYEVTVSYTKSLIKRVTLKFWIRFIGWKYLFFLVFATLFIAFLLVMGMHGWFITVFATVLGISLLVIIWGYFVYYHRSLSTLMKMDKPEAKFIFDDEGLAVVSDIGESKLKWKAILKVDRFPEAWLLYYNERLYATFPIDNASPEALDFIIIKVKEAGGKVQR